MHGSLKSVPHRPWALPSGPWVMAQNWHDLLFAHWPVETAMLRRIVPAGLQLDEFDGQAWISVVPFTMSGVRLRGTPAVPWLSAFPELNVRTYVTAGGKPGVWFFSLDAANAVAVKIARGWFHLPYFHAEMRAEMVNGEIDYFSRRKKDGAVEFAARYIANGRAFAARAGTIEYFLTERYCLYAQSPDGVLLRGEIHHAPWLLREAKASILVNSMASRLGIELKDAPAFVQFAKLQEVIVWAPKRLER